MNYVHNYFLILIIVIGLNSCVEKAEIIKEASFENNNPIVTTENTKVTVAQSEQKVFEYLIRTKGKIFAKQQTELRFETVGVVQKIYKQNGDWVQEGETIAELNKTALQINFDQTYNELKRSQWSYQFELEEFHRFKDTTTLNEEQRLNLLNSSGLSAARIQYREAQYQLNNATLKAPFSGVIANLFSQMGSLQNTNEVFCTLYTPKPLQIRVEILENDASKIQLGQKASVSLLHSDNKTYKATISQINPLVNPNGMLALLLTLNETAGLLPGMNTNATLHIPQQANVVVPKEAVVIRSGKAVVFTHEGGLAKWNYVTTGMENGKEVEILEGLEANQQVITSNNLQLAHDAPVEVNQENEPK